MRRNKVLHWGILGTGTISNVVTPLINKTKGNQVYAVASRSLEKAALFSRKFDIPHYYDSYQLLLDDPNIDVVYITLPNILHKEWVIKAAKAKKHILCEKPFTVLPKDIKETLEIVKANNVFFMEAFMFRCHPQIQKIIEIIKQGKIGNIKQVNSIFTYPFDPIRDFNSHLNAELKGGAIINLGYYCVSMSLLIAKLTNQFSSVEDIRILAEGETSESDGVAGTSTAILRFSDTLSATVMTSGKYGVMQSCRIIGDKGVMHISHPWVPSQDEEIVIHYFNGQNEFSTFKEIINVKAKHPLQCYEISMVHDCITNGKLEAVHPGPTWRDMLDDTILINKWYETVFKLL